MKFVCMASGPSLCAEDVNYVKAHRDENTKVIVTNTTFRMAPWADILYACDGQWWDKHIDEVEAKFHGERYCYAPKASELYGATKVAGVHGGKLQTPPKISTGGNSGHQAVHLAYNMGARHIYLLGYDMARTFGKSHWHGDHPPGLGNAGPVDRWVGFMEELSKGLKERGVKVINCSRHTALTCFPRAKIKDVL